MSTTGHLCKISSPFRPGRELLPGFGVTCCYGLIDLDQGLLVSASAGHPGPVVVDDKGARQIAANRNEKGPGLGLIRDATYPSIELSLESISRLVMFTDGVLEAENQDGEPYFEKRLLEIISYQQALGTEELLDTILKSVLDFSHNQHFDDDVCLLSVDFT